MLPRALAIAESLPAADGTRRSKALAALSRRLESVDYETLQPLWARAVHIFGSGVRGGLLRDIAATSLVVRSLGGQSAIHDVTERVLETLGRWP